MQSCALGKVSEAFEVQDWTARQDEDEEVESLPPLLSRDQRLPGDSSASVLMRVNTSEAWKGGEGGVGRVG